MEEKDLLEINNYTKVLVPAISYNLKTDNRLLIPFTDGDKIGFINHDGKIVVKPEYNMYYGECYSESDYVRVIVNVPYGAKRSDDSISSYYRPIYGLINYKGDIIFPIEYLTIKPAIGNSFIYSVQSMDGNYGVITPEGKIIVPFGKYDYIGGFDRGYARVKIGKTTNGLVDNNCKWGLINDVGNEVLPVEYDNIWNFYGKNISFTNIVKENTTNRFSLITNNNL